MNTMVRHHPLPMGQSMGLDYVSVLKQNYKIIIGTFFVILSHMYFKKKLNKLKVDHKIKKIQQFFLVIL
jgi:hypothetical protein